MRRCRARRRGAGAATRDAARARAVGGSGPVYEFETTEGNRISDLLTDYAMVRRRAGARRLHAGFVSLAPRTIGCPSADQ